ncbi:MAG TPA: AAA family ATPase [Candidatus Babeliales bacterium]|nr:AAA family ATPase [Candidatus Babeliales bacterium]
MKFLNANFLTLLLGVSVVTSIYSDQVSANNSEAQIEQAESLNVEQRDELLSQLVEQVDNIDFIAKDILIDLKRKTIKLPNIEAAEKQLVSIQTACSKILLSLDVTRNTVTVADIYKTALQIQALEKHVATCVAQSFNNCDEFKIDVATKTLPESVDLEEIIKTCVSTDKNLKTLSKKVPYLGINFFHRTYRGLEATNKKYHVAECALLGVAAAAFVTYIVYKMPYFKTGPKGSYLDLPNYGGKVDSSEGKLNGIPIDHLAGKQAQALREMFIDCDNKCLNPMIKEELEAIKAFSPSKPIGHYLKEVCNQDIAARGKDYVAATMETLKGEFKNPLSEEKQKAMLQNFIDKEHNEINFIKDKFNEIRMPLGYPKRIWNFLTWASELEFTAEEAEQCLLESLNSRWYRFKFGYNKFKEILSHPVLKRVDGTVDDARSITKPLAWIDAATTVSNIHLMDIATAGGFVAVTKKYFNSTKQILKERKRKIHEFLYGGPIKRKNSDARIIDGGLDQVIGNEQAKRAMEEVIQFMADPDKFKRKNIVPPKGVLLIGPTRSGKTYIAEQAAGEISRRRKAAGLKEIEFIPLNHKDLKELSLKTIISVYRQWYGPCVLFIDELHNYRLTTEGDVELLTDFLTTMSGFQEENEGKDPVIIIAATNNPEKMDPALLQNGRFGKQIICEYPNQVERAIAIEKAMDKYNLSLDDDYFLAFAQELLISTEGRSHEDITQVFENALQQSIVSGRALTVEHFDRAMDEEIYHIENSTKALDERERKFLAAQIAGTVMAIHTCQPEKVITRATMRPIKQPIEEKTWYEKNLKKDYTLDGGVFSFNQHDTLSIASGQDLIAECKSLLAPHVAEEIICGIRSTFNLENHQKAVELLEKHILQGVKVEKLSKAKRDQLLDQVFELKEKCEKEIKEALNGKVEQLKALSEALMKRGILSQGELAMLVLTPKEKDELLKKIREMMQQSSQGEQGADATQTA